MTLRRFNTACRTCAGSCRRKLWWFLPIAVLLVLACSMTYAQNQQSSQIPPSDLAHENMNRVAASTAQIEAVLHTNPGLMVELKAWVAKDATDHGQLISDSDLTDAAIFDRLETDIEFRSVATRLLQKYGYLLPKVNPDSPQAKQQELLIQERTKWLAQDQEEQLTQARQQSTRTMQGQNCNSETDPACRSSQRPYPASQQEPGWEGPPSRGVPLNRQNTPGLPQRREPTLEEAELMQTGGFPLGSLPLQPETSSGDLRSLFSGADGGNSGTAGLSRGTSGQLGPFSPASDAGTNPTTNGNLYPDLSRSAIGVDRRTLTIERP